MKVTHNAPPTTQSLETNKTSEKNPARSSNGSDGVNQSGAAGQGSNVQISDEARLMQKAADIVSGTPDVRKDKVAALKKAIADGSYQIDTKAVADKLVDEHLASHLGQNEI